MEGENSPELHLPEPGKVGASSVPAPCETGPNPDALEAAPETALPAALSTLRAGTPSARPLPAGAPVFPAGGGDGDAPPRAEIHGAASDCDADAARFPGESGNTWTCQQRAVTTAATSRKSLLENSGAYRLFNGEGRLSEIHVQSRARHPEAVGVEPALGRGSDPDGRPGGVPGSGRERVADGGVRRDAPRGAERHRSGPASGTATAASGEAGQPSRNAGGCNGGNSPGAPAAGIAAGGHGAGAGRSWPGAGRNLSGNRSLAPALAAIGTDKPDYLARGAARLASVVNALPESRAPATAVLAKDPWPDPAACDWREIAFIGALAGKNLSETREPLLKQEQAAGLAARFRAEQAREARLRPAPAAPSLPSPGPR